MGCSDNTLLCSTSLKYPEASDWVAALLTPSDAVITTSAMGSSFIGVSLALDHCAFNGYRQPLGNHPQAVGTQKQK